MKQTGQEAVRAGLSTSEVEQVKKAARSQDAPDLAQRRSLLLRREVVEHQGREHEIEGCRGIRQLVREPSIEPDGDRFSLRLAPRSGERLRVGVEPDHLDVRMEALDQHHQTARAAPDVENALTRANPGLLEERSAGVIAADELHERVVEWQEPVVAGRGKIRPPTSAGRFDRRRHGYNLVRETRKARSASLAMRNDSSALSASVTSSGSSGLVTT